ncbi:MAG: 16S rRNA (cytosine(967)-C(5))-methyltransferase RsmB [Acidobacteriota bacterium]|nr:16S rRNA (cytosine(967)-C(5))-methyltransferase RsmB [Acidobacteriota bacterium]
MPGAPRKKTGRRAARGPAAPARLASPARRAAFAVLLRLEPTRERPRPPRPDALIARLEDAEGQPPSDRDRALARELVFGVLRRRRALDYALDTYSRRPVGKLDLPVRTALRIGLYQLRYLDRVPASAAVHEAVSLAATAARPGAAGLVNAVLRAYLRADHPWPHPGGDRNLYLRAGLSYPDWMVDRCLGQLGTEGARRRLEAGNRSPVVFLRVSRRLALEEVRTQLAQDGVETERFPIAPRCLRVTSGNPRDSSLFREGAIHIQDAGSQLVAWLLPVDGARRCLDACAAPGGKATILAERIEPRPLIAADLRPGRVDLLDSTVRRLASGNVLRLAADAAHPPFAAATFDRILLDVPCSGLGTLARNPDIKWTASTARVRELGETAGRIARAAADLLASGGMLLYSACSLEPEETSDAIHGLLSARPALRQLSLAHRLPEALAPLVDDHGALRVAPEDHGTDGYFAALVQRTDA